MLPCPAAQGGELLPERLPVLVDAVLHDLAASRTKSRRGDSSDMKTRRFAGAYAIPSGNRGPATRAPIRSVESSTTATACSRVGWDRDREHHDCERKHPSSRPYGATR